MILNQNQIYILDDEEGVRKSFDIILSSEGYKTKVFSAGKELVQHVQELSVTAPAVALVDLRLPDISGIAVMQAIKRYSPETEVVMLTGNPDLTSAVDCVNAGAYAYMLKPYNMDEIKTVLKKIFEKQRLVKENRELTQKLKDWNERLEDEIHSRTIALQESYKKLQNLYQMRTQFVSIMSHELRTPATALMGFADTLKDNWKSLPQDKIQEYLNIIGLESGRMVLLMSEIFEIAKIQEGKLDLKLEPGDLYEVLAGLANEFRLNHPSYSFGFMEKRTRLGVHADAFYLKIAFSHILYNSVKYSPSGGHVDLAFETKNGQHSILIIDDGPGIAPELREKVFEPFYRSMDDINRRTPGAGLGLSIARGILNAMSGTVRIENRPSGKAGCCIAVTLPEMK